MREVRNKIWYHPEMRTYVRLQWISQERNEAKMMAIARKVTGVDDNGVSVTYYWIEYT